MCIHAMHPWEGVGLTLTYIRGPPESETGVQYALMDFLSRENSRVKCCMYDSEGGCEE